MMKVITDLETWLYGKGEDMLFNVFLKKHIFTPYEQEQKFSDESTEELVLELVYIKEAIVLPDSDVLIGFCISGCDDKPPIYYYKLSEIRIVRVDYDE